MFVKSIFHSIRIHLFTIINGNSYHFRAAFFLSPIFFFSAAALFEETAFVIKCYKQSVSCTAENAHLFHNISISIHKCAIINHCRLPPIHRACMYIILYTHSRSLHILSKRYEQHQVETHNFLISISILRMYIYRFDGSFHGYFRWINKHE